MVGRRVFPWWVGSLSPKVGRALEGPSSRYCWAILWEKRGNMRRRKGSILWEK